MDCVKNGFYEMLNMKDDYFNFYDKNPTKINKPLIIKYLASFFKVLNPIAPHWTEYCYKKYLNPIFEKFDKSQLVSSILCNAKFPDYSHELNLQDIKKTKYVKNIIKLTNEAINQHKKKKNQTPTEIEFIVCKDYADWQLSVFKVLNDKDQFVFDENNKTSKDIKAKILNGCNIANSEKSVVEKYLQFASFIIKQVEQFGKEMVETELSFQATDGLENYKLYISKMCNLSSISSSVGSDSKALGAASPGTPNIIIIK
jgi:leucyl-tRNA synthetase